MKKRTRQDWVRLFSKKRFELHFGSNYTTSQSSITQTVRNAAVRHGFKVSIIDRDTHIVVYVKGKSEAGAKGTTVHPPPVVTYNSAVRARRSTDGPDALPPARGRD